MTAVDLIRLAERCQREEPSADLDAHIAVALRIGPDEVEDNHWLYRNFPNWRVRSDGRVEAQANGVHWAPNPFTSRIDAAMTLVPEQCGVDLNRYWLMEGERWSATTHWGVSGDHAVVLDIPTAALALSAAALRARAALMERGS